MKPDDRVSAVERLVERLTPPQPPPELRSRTLGAARRRWNGAEGQDVWVRIWNHRRLRLAWAAAVVLLLAGHIVATPSRVAAPTRVEPASAAENRVDEYLAGMLRPVRISENVQPMVGLFDGASGPIELELEGNPS